MFHVKTRTIHIHARLQGRLDNSFANPLNDPLHEKLPAGNPVVSLYRGILQCDLTSFFAARPGHGITIWHVMNFRSQSSTLAGLCSYATWRVPGPESKKAPGVQALDYKDGRMCFATSR